VGSEEAWAFLDLAAWPFVLVVTEEGLSSSFDMAEDLFVRVAALELAPLLRERGRRAAHILLEGLQQLGPLGRHAAPKRSSWGPSASRALPWAQMASASRALAWAQIATISLTIYTIYKYCLYINNTNNSISSISSRSSSTSSIRTISVTPEMPPKMRDH
jgi:hypothetical protein